MIIFPAIDLKNGECVRLKKGDMNTSEKVAESPVQTALSFAACGAQWMHMVDLDGAVGEINDLLYHFAVLMANEGITIDEVYQEHARRNAQELNLKKFHSVAKNS